MLNVHIYTQIYYIYTYTILYIHTNILNIHIYTQIYYIYTHKYTHIHIYTNIRGKKPLQLANSSFLFLCLTQIMKNEQRKKPSVKIEAVNSIPK